MNFSEAAEQVKKLKTKPSDNDLLSLYAYYKQATVGDCNGEIPSFWNYVARAKFNAWDALRGVSVADAEKQYIAIVERLVEQDTKDE